MKILILCKGNTEIGLGHIFRSISFARTAAKTHDIRMIAIAPHNLDTLFTPIAENTRLIDNEELSLPLIEDFTPDVIIFDMTKIGNSTFKQIKEYQSVTACISPIFSHMEFIDIYASRTTINTAGENTSCYAGLEYTIFNHHCTPIPDHLYNETLNNGPLPTAICMGGSDSFNKTLHVLTALARAREAGLFWVLIGNGYDHAPDMLMKTIALSPQHEIIIARTNRSMWRIMQNCALSIVPGGLSFIESAYAGLPTISLFEYGWHRDALQNLLDKDITIDVGDMNVATLQKLPDIFDNLSRNRNKLLKMRDSCRGLIDNKGSQRVLNIIENHLNPQKIQLVK